MRSTICFLCLVFACACGGTISPTDPDADSVSPEAGACDKTSSLIALATIDSPDDPAHGALMVRGEDLYYGVVKLDTSRPRGDIRRVSRRGGPVRTFVTDDFYEGPIASDGVDVFFPHVASFPAIRSTLAAQAIDGGPLRVLPLPIGTQQIITVETNSSRGAYFSAYQGGPSVLARWDGMTTTTVDSPHDFRNDFLVDDAFVYWTELAGPDRVELFRAPLELGQPELLAELDGPYDLFAQDETHLFLHDVRNPRPIAMASKNEKRLPAALGPALAWDVATVHGGFLVAVPASGAPILLVPADGGPIETGPTPDGVIVALTSDACAIYFVEEGRPTSRVMRWIP